ncbi:nucleoside-diphosphate sugar epimerase [Paenibacillus humicola]|uniref:nucleoside-diphosphate sugar epimerase n=1 Tax=Paenibacillus humicola TaxID=3110540 RepID=UPI00237AFD28|nr:nucleoside-diphosphate sugar epimerase [Paenibacillus humicola]
MQQHTVTELIEHISQSHQHMVRVLESERHVAVRMAHMVHALPDRHPDFGGMDGLLQSSGAVTKSVVAYLNTIAELQESMATTIGSVMKELDGDNEEE